MAKTHAADHHHKVGDGANVEQTDVSFPLIVAFFVISALLMLISGGLTWGLWNFLAAQADETSKSDYTLANQMRKKLLDKYPERDANGFYYERFRHTLPPVPRLEGITGASDLDHAVMSGNLAWPSQGAIQKKEQTELLNQTKMAGKEVLSIGEIMKDLNLPVRKSSKDDQRLLEYYQGLGAGSSGRSSLPPAAIQGEKP